jgi:hypothetical protein
LLALAGQDHHTTPTGLSREILARVPVTKVVVIKVSEMALKTSRSQMGGTIRVTTIKTKATTARSAVRTRTQSSKVVILGLPEADKIKATVALETIKTIIAIGTLATLDKASKAIAGKLRTRSAKRLSR